MDPEKINELKALISLADEPDIRVYAEISEKIYSYGKDAIPFLAESADISPDDGFRKRIFHLISSINSSEIQEGLKRWSHSGAVDLFTPFSQISHFKNSVVNQEAMRMAIDLIKKDVWLEISMNSTPLEKIRVINHVFFSIHQYANKKEIFYPLSTWYLNTVLKTKNGNPLTLGILYLIIAQEMKIPVFGVNLPDHFILAYTNADAENKLEFLNENEVLFYINPFSNGDVFTKKELDLFLKEKKLEPRLSYYTPCCQIDIIKRLLNDLSLCYSHLNQIENAAKFKQFMESLTS